MRIGTDEQWRKNFTPRTLYRGRRYYYNDAVESLVWTGTSIRGIVSGERKYHVEIMISDSDVAGMSCDCPQAEKGSNCKHMAAVLFAASSDAFPDSSVEKYKQALENAIRSLSGAGARAILFRAAQKYPDIAAQIIRHEERQRDTL